MAGPLGVKGKSPGPRRGPAAACGSVRWRRTPSDTPFPSCSSRSLRSRHTGRLVDPPNPLLPQGLCTAVLSGPFSNITAVGSTLGKAASPLGASSFVPPSRLPPALGSQASSVFPVSSPEGKSIQDGGSVLFKATPPGPRRSPAAPSSLRLRPPIPRGVRFLQGFILPTSPLSPAAPLQSLSRSVACPHRQ